MSTWMWSVLLLVVATVGVSRAQEGFCTGLAPCAYGTLLAPTGPCSDLVNFLGQNGLTYAGELFSSDASSQCACGCVTNTTSCGCFGQAVNTVQSRCGSCGNLILRMLQKLGNIQKLKCRLDNLPQVPTTYQCSVVCALKYSALDDLSVINHLECGKCKQCTAYRKQLSGTASSEVSSLVLGNCKC